MLSFLSTGHAGSVNATMMSTYPCPSTCAGGPGACAQVTTLKQQEEAVLCQPSLLLRCPQRGPPLSPNATQRTALIQGILSTPQHSQWRTVTTFLLAFSCLLLPRPLRCQPTFTRTIFIISTPTPTHCPNPSPCSSTPRAQPMTLPSARLLSHCTS